MSFITIGDLARSWTMRQDMSLARTALDTAAAEVASGRRADAPREIGSRMGDFSQIERRLSAIDVRLSTAAEIRQELEASQGALAHVGNMSKEAYGSLMQVGTLASDPSVTIVGQSAMRAFEGVVGALNTGVAGRSLFAGVATDSPALAEAETMMTAIEAEITSAGATTVAAIETVIDTWFAPGGGFDIVGYLGSPTPREPPHLMAGAPSEPSPRADVVEVRDTLAALAKGALVGRSPALDLASRSALAKAAGLELLEVSRGIVDIKARVGESEAQLDLSETELRAEALALVRARMELVGADPFEAASDLADAEARLQTIYAITARLSRLSLADYLR